MQSSGQVFESGSVPTTAAKSQSLNLALLQPSSQKCRLDLAPPWADRFIWGLSPSIAARHFSSGPSDSTSRWTPCPPKYSKRWLQVGLGCIQLSLSCPFRPLHTFRFLRPARLRTPLLGYGAPHLSARGTSTLLNNALLSAHFRFADHTLRTPLDSVSRTFSITTAGRLCTRSNHEVWRPEVTLAHSSHY